MRRFLFAVFVFTFVACTSLMTSRRACAQISSSTGAIQGTVTDPSNAVVVGAKVTLTNTATGESRVGTTHSDGSFVFPLLVPGIYSVAVESSGFQRAVLSGLVVEITKVRVANVKLEIGAMSNEVKVTASAEQVDTRTATTGDVIGGQLIRELSLPTRNFLSLMALEPGVGAVMGSPATVGRGSAVLFVAGQRGTANNFVLDGVDANNYGNNNFGAVEGSAGVPVPNPDAIQEFRVSTSLYDATQGRNSGGNIDVLLRSGTNEYHGSAFDFYRDSIFNANDFFFNKNKVNKPILLQNQFGFSLGGPVPKLHHTFWFASYQGTRQKNGVSGAISGFQPVLPASRTAAALQAAFFPTGLPSGKTIDPVAVAWLNRPGQYGGFLYPSGGGVGVAPGQTGRFSFSSPTIFNEDQFAATLDHDLFTNNHIVGRMFWASDSQFSPTGGGVSLGQGQNSPLTNWHAAITDTESFTPNVVNQLTAGFTLIRSAAVPVEGTKVGDIGMTRFNQTFFPGTPAVFLSGLLSGLGISTNNDQGSANMSATVADTASWSLGKQTIRFGGEFRRYQFNIFNNFASRGFLNFVNVNGLSSFQNFLIGSPVQVFAGTGITDRGYRAYDLSFFGQDDYRLTSRLTLNLGLRWDYLAPSTDIRNRIGNFDPALLPAGCALTGGACLRAGFIAPSGLAGFGTPGVSPSTLLSVDKTNFAPRLGFAYDVFGNGKVAVRGGYGIYYIRTSGQTLLQGITGAPFFQLTNLVNTTPSVCTTSNGADCLNNPFPALPTPNQFPILPAFPAFTGFSAAGTPQFNSNLLTLNPVQRNVHTPYSQSYNLSAQWEFQRGWVAEVGYIGSRAIKLLDVRQVNNALLVNAANPGAGGLNVNSNRNVNARVGVVGFSANGLNETTDAGESWYNGAIVSVKHAFSNGLNLKVDYTFSRSIDNDSGAFTQDLGNAGGNQLVPALDKGLSDFDQTHRLVITYHYEIPGPKAGWQRQVLGGWAVSGTNTFQSGFPFDVFSSVGGSLSGVGTGTSRADVTCKSGLTRTGNVSNLIDNYINTACFADPATKTAGTVLTNLTQQQAPGTQSFVIGDFGSPNTGTGTLFGNAGRNILRAPFQTREDFAVLKTFPTRFIRETSNLEFRAEFFKLFNTPIFDAPSSTVGTSSFGHIGRTTDSTGRVMQFALKLNF